MQTTSQPSTISLPRPLIIMVFVLLLLALILNLSDAEWWKVVVLGMVQGLTEFLPISSTGHLLIVSSLLRYEGSIGGTFEIFIQVGTVIAVVAYYLSDLLSQSRAILGQGVTVEERDRTRRFWLCLLVAFIPAAMIGLLARDFIKAVLFETPQVIAGALIFGGIIFIWLENLPARMNLTTDPKQLGFGQALAIGVAQCFALIPGMSRSGSSIVGGLLAGLDRRTATTFSFYLAIPTLGAATFVDLIGSIDLITRDDVNRLFLGTIISMIVGWVSIGWLLRYVARNSFAPFGVYRIIVGVVILVLAGMGIL